MVSLKLPIKWLFLNVGDKIKFDKLLGDVKAYGVDYTADTELNGQSIYPLFFITSVQKSLDNISIKAIQLHNLEDSIVGEEEEDEEEEVVVEGCTDASASNYNSNATIDNGSCVYGPSDDQVNPPSILAWQGLIEFSVFNTYNWQQNFCIMDFYHMMAEPYGGPESYNGDIYMDRPLDAYSGGGDGVADNQQWQIGIGQGQEGAGFGDITIQMSDAYLYNFSSLFGLGDLSWLGTDYWDKGKWFISYDYGLTKEEITDLTAEGCPLTGNADQNSWYYADGADTGTGRSPLITIHGSDLQNGGPDATSDYIGGFYYDPQNQQLGWDISVMEDDGEGGKIGEPAEDFNMALQTMLEAWINSAGFGQVTFLYLKVWNQGNPALGTGDVTGVYYQPPQQVYGVVNNSPNFLGNFNEDLDNPENSSWDGNNTGWLPSEHLGPEDYVPPTMDNTGDEIVNILDIVGLVSAVLGHTNFDEDQFYNSDVATHEWSTIFNTTVYGDGTLDILDIMVFVNWLVNTEFPTAEPPS